MGEGCACICRKKKGEKLDEQSESALFVYYFCNYAYLLGNLFSVRHKKSLVDLKLLAVSAILVGWSVSDHRFIYCAEKERPGENAERMDSEYF